MKKVTIIKAHSPYRVGDVAGVDDDVATKLVELGVAKEGEVEVPADEPKEEVEEKEAVPEENKQMDGENKEIETK